jgi:thioredoxin 1
MPHDWSRAGGARCRFAPKTAAKYGIQSIPTLMIFKDGQMASRQVGAAPKQKLEQWITAAV